MDSHVLLHAMAGLRPQFGQKLLAVHVDHGLHEDSASWNRHCRLICESLAVELRSCRLVVGESDGEGPEDAARNARYRWFTSIMRPKDILLLAHHQDDQAETLLYNLIRGAGVHGLAAMPVSKLFAQGCLCRPLLHINRNQLRDYASRHQLKWVDDPGNDALEFDRNFIRHSVIPLIRSRWPSGRSNIARAASNLADLLPLLRDVAGQDLLDAHIEGAFHPFSSDAVLDIGCLNRMSGSRFRNLLRHWLSNAGHRLPSRQRQELLRDWLQQASGTNGGKFAWPGVELGRYRNRLYLLPALADCQRDPISWDIGGDLEIPGTPLKLVSITVSGSGVRRELFEKSALTVDWVTANRRFRATPGSISKPLRKIFQELGVPPWIRRILPRIYLDGELVCIPGVLVSSRYEAAAGDAGIEFELRGADKLSRNPTKG